MTWDPVAAIYGALPYVVGTILTSLIAVVIAAPIGLLTAIFLAELAPRRVAIPLTFMIELLAAIPSVVFGLWGVFILGPFLGHTIEAWTVEHFGWIPIFAGPPYGIGLFTAGIILAIMIVPTIVSISREVISSVPNSQREAMAALGATRWETVTKAVLPFARSGIVGAIILGLGRALGETMAVTMVIGNRQNIPKGLFDQAQTIASKIATTFNEATIGIQTSSLIALGFILLVLTIGLNVVARLLVWRVAGPIGGE
jgi:phosphate transport system permease protein